MLSDAEQRKLSAIESQLRLDDPVFVERFTGGSTGRTGGGWRGTATLVAMMVGLTVVGIGLVLSNVLTVVIALTAIGAVAGLWITSDDRQGR
jgi:hypothetical protein